MIGARRREARRGREVSRERAEGTSKEIVMVSRYCLGRTGDSEPGRRWESRSAHERVRREG